MRRNQIRTNFAANAARNDDSIHPRAEFLVERSRLTPSENLPLTGVVPQTPVLVDFGTFDSRFRRLPDMASRYTEMSYDHITTAAEPAGCSSPQVEVEHGSCATRVSRIERAARDAFGAPLEARVLSRIGL